MNDEAYLRRSIAAIYDRHMREAKLEAEPYERMLLALINCKAPVLQFDPHYFDRPDNIPELRP